MSIDKDVNGTIVLNMSFQNQGKHVNYLVERVEALGADGQVVMFDLPDRFWVPSPFMEKAIPAFYTLIRVRIVRHFSVTLALLEQRTVTALITPTRLLQLARKG